MNSELGIYQVTEQQLDLLSACIDSWRSSTFWVLMYLQSFLFRADNVGSIERELNEQPTQYAQIFGRFYGKEYTLLFHSNPHDTTGFLKQYLMAVSAKQRKDAAEIKKRWTAHAAHVSDRFGMLNPYWNASLWETMLTHYIDLICSCVDDDLLGRYQEIGDTYLVMDWLASDLGEYMATGIIKQFNIN